MQRGPSPRTMPQKPKRNPRILDPCSLIIPFNLSRDISKSAASENDAFKAYEKYRDDESSFKSTASFKSQNTFSTFGDGINEAGLTQVNPMFTCMTWQSKWAEQVVKSRTFKRVSIALIVIFCIICAIATADFVTEDEDMKYVFDVIKDTFVYIMTVELFLQFLAKGFGVFSKGWLIFDCVWICSAWVVPNLLVMRTFRVVRTLRLASWVEDLKELVLALLLVIPKMFAIFFLLMILYLIFAILFTDLFKHAYAEGYTKEDYFGRLDVTFFTLFQIMTLDSWAEICKQVSKMHEYAWAPFIGFVIVSSFFFLNLVIAVVCDAVTTVHKNTVVKYIQDDISAATSVREALKVEDRLEELSASVQLLLRTQIKVLESLQSEEKELSGNTTPHKNFESTPEQSPKLDKPMDELRKELEGSLLGSRDQAWLSATSQRELLSDYQLEMGVKDSKEPTMNPHMKFQINAGPATPVFWRNMGLTEAQVSKVMASLSERRLMQMESEKDGLQVPRLVTVEVEHTTTPDDLRSHTQVEHPQPQPQPRPQPQPQLVPTDRTQLPRLVTVEIEEASTHDSSPSSTHVDQLQPPLVREGRQQVPRRATLEGEQALTSEASLSPMHMDPLLVIVEAPTPEDDSWPCASSSVPQDDYELCDAKE